MTQTTLHNPDRFMADLRQILAQGRKRIGLLIGAGAPVALKVNKQGKLDDDGQPLIPDVERLTQAVLATLKPDDNAVVAALVPDLGEKPNIEIILTRIRRLSQSIGKAEGPRSKRCRLRSTSQLHMQKDRVYRRAITSQRVESLHRARFLDWRYSP